MALRMRGPLKVLIVDDEPAILHALGVLFDLHEIAHLGTRSPEEAQYLLRREAIGVVVQDMNFGGQATSGEQGVALFRALREIDPEVPVLLMTAWASLENAVRLIKQGADDYLAKPWDDDKLVLSVQNLLRMRRLQLDNRRLAEERRLAREEIHSRYDLRGIVYESAAMHELVTLAANVAASDAPILITGPSGSGKERLAEIVQANSRRRGRQFLRVNVGALPAELLEAELFGAEAGAYTGATRMRIGLFETADGGTLFLDEIDALPPAGQVKLLRVLQSGEFQRLGSSAPRHADVRVISASNADLRAAIDAGRFREDLYYRLNVIELAVPPLERRLDDVLPLARHFLAVFAPADRPRPFVLSPDAERALAAHRWDGNVRELENRVRRATLTATGDEIGAAELGLGAEPPDSSPVPAEGPLAPERAQVEHALLAAGGIVARAAEQLGLSRQALYRRMERLGIVVERRPGNRS
jgi:DNA-binding NtrC family response regulator